MPKTVQIAFTLFSIAWSAPVTAWSSVLYTAVDIGGFGGTTVANGINNAGQVVGSSNGHAFLYSGGVMTDLGPGSANAINSSGQIAGHSGTTNHAFL